MIFRVQKNKNYTTMNNHHLKDKNLSFKAKGLLSMFLSLPDDWDYSINGIVSISKESETSVKSTLKELKDNGYLEIVKLLPNQTKTGRFEYEYNIYEIPKQEGGFLGVEFLKVENVGQLNTNIQSTKELSTKEKKKIIIKEKFETFWKAYPKKLNRAKALTWFEKHLPDDETFNTIMIKLEMFKNTDQWQKDNGQYIPYATTWLNQKRWEDEIESEQEDLNYYHEEGCVQFGRRRC